MLNSAGVVLREDDRGEDLTDRQEQGPELTGINGNVSGGALRMTARELALAQHYNWVPLCPAHTSYPDKPERWLDRRVMNRGEDRVCEDVW